MAKTKSKATSDEAFSKHAEQDSALSKPAADDDGTLNKSSKGLTTIGKIFVFLVFPVTIGVIALYIAYLETRRTPDKALNFDQDFMVPFLLALAMSIVIGIQTGGFTTNEVKPLVPWPKVRRVKTIVRKKKKNGQIVEVVEASENENETTSKKDN